MNCPFCNSTQIVVSNSRPTAGGTQIWRRRKCIDCDQLFTTHEIIDLSHLIVIKSNRKKEKYSRVKLYSGIYNATVSSRPAEKQRLVEEITQDVEKQILGLKKKKVKSAEIGEIVLQSLKKLSPGAFLSFLTYYKDIKSNTSTKRYIKKYLGKY